MGDIVGDYKLRQTNVDYNLQRSSAGSRLLSGQHVGSYNRLSESILYKATGATPNTMATLFSNYLGKGKSATSEPVGAAARRLQRLGTENPVAQRYLH